MSKAWADGRSQRSASKTHHYKRKAEGKKKKGVKEREGRRLLFYIRTTLTLTEGQWVVESESPNEN